MYASIYDYATTKLWRQRFPVGKMNPCVKLGNKSAEQFTIDEQQQVAMKSKWKVFAQY